MKLSLLNGQEENMVIPIQKIMLVDSMNLVKPTEGGCNTTTVSTTEQMALTILCLMG